MLFVHEKLKERCGNPEVVPYRQTPSTRNHDRVNVVRLPTLLQPFQPLLQLLVTLYLCDIIEHNIFLVTE